MLLSLCAIRRVLTSKAMERLLMITAGETATISETDLSPCNPQANSTVLDTFPTESGYVTKGSEATNLPLNDEVDFLGKFWNGQGLGSTDTSMSVCQVTFKESGERLRCCIARGRVEESRTLRSYPSLLLHSRKLRTTRCMAERVNNKLSSVLARTPIKKHLKKGLVRRSPL